MPSYPAVIPGWFNPEVEIFRGFWMITWFKNEFAHKEVKKAEKHNIPAEEVMNALLHLAPPGSLGLMVQPFWGAGLSEPAAKGAMIGYGDVHKKPHVYRSVIEGLIYALREGKEKIEKVSGEKIEKLTVSGGGSQSNEICQIAADIFNLPLLRGKHAESTGLGAAIVTACGLGFYISFEEAVAKMVSYRHEFIPNKKNVEIYDKLYKQIYLKMYKSLEPLYQKIRDITGYPEK
jgi:sugar (pentulose or hexulose) kinase